MDSTQGINAQGDVKSKKIPPKAGLNASDSPAKEQTFSSESSEKKSSDNNSNVNNSNVNNSNFNNKEKSSSESASWIDEINSHVSTLERDVQGFITKRPVTVAAAAIGLGVAGTLILKKINANRNTTGEKSDTIDVHGPESGKSFLGEGLSTTLGKIKKEVDHLATDQFHEVRDNIADFVTSEMKEKPYQTLATAVGVGIGMANLRSEQIKSGAFRIAKLLAMKSLGDIETKKLSTDKND